MSRGIEFRCWNEHGKCFHGMSELGDKLHLFNNKNPSYVIEQFTGLLDCNGVKIFEGDIVHFELDDFDIYFEVAIDSRGCFVARNHLQENDFYFLDDFDYTVAGNIHQHPELLA